MKHYKAKLFLFFCRKFAEIGLTTELRKSRTMSRNYSLRPFELTAKAIGFEVKAKAKKTHIAGLDLLMDFGIISTVP